MDLKARIKGGQLQLLKNGAIIASTPAGEGQLVEAAEEVVGNVSFHLNREALAPLSQLAERRGVPREAIACRFVEQGLGKVCLPCAGMGTNDDATLCQICKGDGVNPRAVSECQGKLRRFQLMVKHIAALAEDPHPLTYERAGGGCVCAKCGLEYVEHPKGSEDFLTLLCDGSQVKL